jgi:fatty acid desaturase
VFFVALVGIAAQQHALFVLTHEAAHYRMFRVRGLNDLVGRVAGTLGGVSMCTYRVTHRLHHNHLYGAQDPDIALNGGYPRGAWYLVKLLWVLPLITFLQVILRLRAVAEHGAPSGYDSPLNAARTNLPGAGPLGWLVRFVFFPHHVNFHIEHHLYPAIPHYRLKAAHELLKAKGALDGAKVRLFSDTVKRVFQAKGSLPEAIRVRT